MNINSELAAARSRDFHEAAANHRAVQAARRARRAGHTQRGRDPDRVVIRRAADQDGAAIAQLADLNAAPRPRGEMLLVELEGRIVAAVPVAGGDALGDPFAPTAQLIDLAERRAKLLREPAQQRRGRVAALLGTLHGQRPAA